MQNGRNVVQTTHRERHDEHRQRQKHEDDPQIGARCTGRDRLRWIQGPASAGRAARNEEAGDEDVFRKIQTDLKGHNISDDEIRNKMKEFNEKAKSEFI